MANDNEAQMDVAPSEAESAKLTDWAKEPSLMELKADFTDAQSSHQNHENDVQRWLDNLYVQGKADPKTTKKKKDTNRSSIQPKVIRKQAEWRYSAISEPFLSTPDVYNVAPASAEDTEAARQNGLILNHQFNNRIDKVAFMDELARTLVDEGTAIVRVGWEYAEEDVTYSVPVYEYVPSDAAIQEMEDLNILLQTDPNVYATQSAELLQAHELYLEDGIPRLPNKTNETEEISATKITKNQPVLEVCDYRNVIIDPTCKGKISKANFVIFSFETSLSELKKDGDRYSNLDQINIKAEGILSNPDHHSEDASAFNFRDKERKKFVAYEYWGYYDIDGTGIAQPFVATWVGSTLIRMERNPFPDQKIPFVLMQYLPKRKSNYGEPDGELLEDNQKVIGAVTRGMMDTMARSANGQVGTRKDALDVVNRRKFQNGEDYEYNPGMTPNDVIHMHTYPEIPQAAQIMLAMQHSEAESLTGIKAFNNGITGESLGDSTGLGKSALDAASKREMGILRRVSQGMWEIGLKIISMNGVFLSEEESVRVTGESFEVIRRDQLEGNFDLKLSISTPEADAAKAEELAFMLQTMDNTTPPELRNMLLSEIATLRNMPELAKKLREFVPQPDPIAQEKAQLENEKLKAEVAKLYAEAEETKAKASKTTLDHVEQEEGVTHARDMEMSQSQAQSNLTRDLALASIKAQQDRQSNTQ